MTDTPDNATLATELRLIEHYLYSRGWKEWSLDVALASDRLKATAGQPLDPDMPAKEIRLHMGEMPGYDIFLVRAAIRWANSQRPV